MITLFSLVNSEDISQLALLFRSVQSGLSIELLLIFNIFNWVIDWQ